MELTKTRVLVTAPYYDRAREELGALFGEVLYKPWKAHGRGYRPDELIKLLDEADAEAFITEHDEVTEEVIRSRPGLKFIGVCRGTPSNVAVGEATRRGIPVFNTPARNAQAVAEMFISNVIALLRNTLPGVEWLREGQWGEGAHTSYLQFKGNEIAGKTVGMVGFGATGLTIARLLRHFPARINYYDPYVTAAEEEFEKVTLEEVFMQSDIVSIHLPVTPDTVGMIDAKLISLMKPWAVFVNTARAAVVKREALLDALEQGRIRGAVLDVFDHEPPDAVDYRLIRHRNVLATPHIAGATHEVEDHHADILNRALQQFYVKGNRHVPQLVNPQVLP